MKTNPNFANTLCRLIWLGLMLIGGVVRAQTADVQAISMSLSLPAGDPRGQHPTSLTYKLLNAGPDNLLNNAYLVEVYLAVSGVAPDSGTLLGSHTNMLTLAAGQTNNASANATTLNQFMVPHCPSDHDVRPLG